MLTLGRVYSNFLIVRFDYSGLLLGGSQWTFGEHCRGSNGDEPHLYRCGFLRLWRADNLDTRRGVMVD